MNKTLTLSVLKLFWQEFLIVALLALSLNQFLGISGQSISSDGVGYYDYLPSLFIHHDLYRLSDHQDQSRIDKLSSYVEYKDKKVNKYPIGTALLQSPFFMVNYLAVKGQNTTLSGYEKSFHRVITLSNWFYLFLGLYFFKRFLLSFEANKNTILITQLLLVFATPILHYANEEASFSHVYSFFALTAFLYFIRLFFQHHKWKHFFWSAFFISLIVLLRQINILVLLALPFIAGNFEHLKSTFTLIFRKWFNLILALLIACSVISIQLFAWYAQTGEWIIYSYQGEGFNFLDPAFIDILFSYKKGLFVYTPVLFLSIVGFFIWTIRQQNYYYLTTWVFFFTVLTYVLSSWWSWYYGSSFGLRAYIDFYALLFFPLPFFIAHLEHLIARFMIIGLGIVFTAVNFIQVYQYNAYILHWDSMNKEKYWQVFLKTEEKYQGLVWKNTPQLDFEIINSITEKQIEIPPHLSKSFQLELTDTVYPSHIRISTVSNFNENSNTLIYTNISDGDKTSYYYNKLYLLHLQEKGLNQLQRGSYVLSLPNLEGSSLLEVNLHSGHLAEKLTDFRIELLQQKEAE